MRNPKLIIAYEVFYAYSESKFCFFKIKIHKSIPIENHLEKLIDELTGKTHPFDDKVLEAIKKLYYAGEVGSYFNSNGIFTSIVTEHV